VGFLGAVVALIDTYLDALYLAGLTSDVVCALLADVSTSCRAHVVWIALALVVVWC
jgi:hypothetical protein